MHAFRIFDSVLNDHSWAADGRLCIAQQPQSDSLQEASPKAAIDAFFSRLLLRSKSDRILCRAAKRLHADPSISSGQLAAGLGVSERYLLSGLRAVLGIDPQTRSRNGYWRLRSAGTTRLEPSRQDHSGRPVRTSVSSTGHVGEPQLDLGIPEPVTDRDGTRRLLPSPQVARHKQHKT